MALWGGPSVGAADGEHPCHRRMPCPCLGHLMLLPMVAVIFLKQRDSEDHIMLDFCPHPF